MAAVYAGGVRGMERQHGTHPFFQSRSIPHRGAMSPDIGDNLESISQPAESNHSNLRKRKSELLTEQPYNPHLPRLDIIDPLVKGNSAEPLVVRCDMEITPKKKVLKLNSNGKLLSSPPLASIDFSVGDKVVKTSPKVADKHHRARFAKPKLQSSSGVVKIGYGRESVEERLRVGSTINELLGTHRAINVSGASSAPNEHRSPKQSTHPFFLGRGKPLPSTAHDEDARKTDSANSDTSMSPAKVSSKDQSLQAQPGWKAISLTSSGNCKRRSRGTSAPWPSLGTQRVDDLQHDQMLQFAVPTSPFQTYKSKGHITQLPREEDVLCRASTTYAKSWREANLCTARQPARNLLSGKEMISRLQDKLLVERIHLATQRLKTSLSNTLTAFDQGKCDQCSWTVKSSPSTAGEVLQLGPEAFVLRDWVKNLAVTAVEGAEPAETAKGSKPPRRKRGRPKRSVDVVDFIVSSGDEADELAELNQSHRELSPFSTDLKRTVIRTGALTSLQDKSQAKNAILLSGPTGCGKTASVYAAAIELDFEVFEINPGTRRGAKEILERVGDMTQNHLVRQASVENPAEDVASTPIDDTEIQNEVASGKQRTMNGFFHKQLKPAAKAGRKRKACRLDDQKAASKVKRPKKSQKQSLILLEEVDILFEDDKTFWSGVMSLINQSKRPIILTCNDESALPLDQLPLHGILRFSSPPEEMATDYLLALAASEGHELGRDAVSFLYQSLKHDLRATITELDFWCQMGIGSRKGGLDWMLDCRESSFKNRVDGMGPRVFSTNTYLRGMGLTMQESERDAEQLVLDAYQQLNIPVDTWCGDADRGFVKSTTIREASIWADLYSDLDMCRERAFESDPSELQLRIAVSMATRLSHKPPISTDIIDAYIQKPQPPQLTPSTLSHILEPLRNEKPTFPPSQGRLAPSLDSSFSTLTTDLAPYIRSIVAYEQKWGANLPAAKRTTRASARPEGHFPKEINPRHVLMTGAEGWQDLWVAGSL